MTDTTDTVTTVRLPHTGLRVPDRSLRVTRYKETPTRAGVAFTANLRVNKLLVGTIENDGHGGGTRFRADDPRSWGAEQLADYAAQCRSEEGLRHRVGDLLDALVDECIWERRTDTADRRGLTPLRLMAFLTDNGRDDGDRIDFPPLPQGSAVSAKPRNDAQWAELAKHVTAAMEPGPHGWWQAWTGEGWRDVTPRPADVAAERYL